MSEISFFKVFFVLVYVNLLTAKGSELTSKDTSVSQGAQKAKKLLR